MAPRSRNVSKPKGRALTKDGPFPRKIVATGQQISPPELCSAQYTATMVQIPDGGDEIIIQASGVHSTSGYEVFFQRSPLSIYPPEFSLWHIKPSGPVLDVITPFSKFATFPAPDPVQYVVIHDASGAHTVKVQTIGGAVAMCT